MLSWHQIPISIKNNLRLFVEHEHIAHCENSTMILGFLKRWQKLLSPTHRCEGTADVKV